jgi:dTDP-4-dehydrorhamnose reductase
LRLLVLGANGQVGRELTRAAKIASFEVRPLGHEELDIGDKAALRAAIGPSFDLVVNAAAYTAVERAESDVANAFRINAEAPRHIAEACATANVPMVHFSTDYVFDGAISRPYTEADQTNPLGIYGQSKLDGEEAVRRTLPKHIILRTSWIYAAHGQNFVRTMLRLGERNERELSVVDDQTGCPTAARDLAEAVIRLAPLLKEERLPWGTYHCAGSGVTTWYGFANEIFRLRKVLTGMTPPAVKPVPSSQYPSKCPRPKNSALDCGLLRQRAGIELRPWPSALQEVMTDLLPERALASQAPD